MVEKTKKPATARVSWTKRLKRDVKYFHTHTGMEFTAIGRHAIKNPRFWDRMAKGGTITLESADEIYEFMATKGYHFNNEGVCDYV
jgi:hypothetical protein